MASGHESAAAAAAAAVAVAGAGADTPSNGDDCVAALNPSLRKVYREFFSTLRRQNAFVRNMGWAKDVWLQREKALNPEPFGLAFGEFVHSMIEAARNKGFAAHLIPGSPLRLAIDNGRWNWSLDLEEIARNRRSAETTAEFFENLTAIDALKNALLPKGHTFTDRLNTLSGVQLAHPLEEFAKKDTPQLIQEFKALNITDSLQSVLLVAELLLRKGFVIEVRVLGLQKYVARVIRPADGQETKFSLMLADVESKTGGYFALDPSYFQEPENLETHGASDVLHRVYSFNTRRLWENPLSFSLISGTTRHEADHIYNEALWFDPNNDEAHNALNGSLTRISGESLTDYTYGESFQFDEATINKDVWQWGEKEGKENSEELQDFDWNQRYRKASSAGCAKAVLTRLAAVRQEVSKGNFTTSISKSGNYLFVKVRVKSEKSEAEFMFAFRDFSLRTPKPKIVERFLRRLDLLEKIYKDI